MKLKISYPSTPYIKELNFPITFGYAIEVLSENRSLLEAPTGWRYFHINKQRNDWRFKVSEIFVVKKQ